MPQTPPKVAVIVGSLRKGSYNRLMAHAVAGLAKDKLVLEIVEIGDLPLYNPDVDDDTATAWKAFREAIKSFDAVLFITPEYNRSVPASLKNAIDVGSRPMGQSALSGKPAAIISCSQGGLSGFGANHHLRQSLVFLDMPTLLQPEAYIGKVNTLFDEAGQLINDDTTAFLTRFIDKFAAWIAKTA